MTSKGDVVGLSEPVGQAPVSRAGLPESSNFVASEQCGCLDSTATSRNEKCTTRFQSTTKETVA